MCLTLARGGRTGRASAASSLIERALLSRVAQGEHAAFVELYGLYHRRLVRFLRRFTRRYDIAEEIINDTLWVVWRKAAEFRGDSLVSTWIMGIAYRRAMKTLQANSDRSDVRGLPVNESAPLTDHVQANNELHQCLEQALAQIPLEQRMVLELTYYLGHSCEEVAQIMDCPINTVKTRMFHGRAKLRALLPKISGNSPEVTSRDS